MVDKTFSTDAILVKIKTFSIDAIISEPIYYSGTMSAGLVPEGEVIEIFDEFIGGVSDNPWTLVNGIRIVNNITSRIEDPGTTTYMHGGIETTTYNRDAEYARYYLRKKSDIITIVHRWWMEYNQYNVKFWINYVDGTTQLLQLSGSENDVTWNRAFCKINYNTGNIEHWNMRDNSDDTHNPPAPSTTAMSSSSEVESIQVSRQSLADCAWDYFLITHDASSVENIKYFKADALLSKEQTKTFSADAILIGEKTFTINVILKKEQTKTFILDGIVDYLIPILITPEDSSANATTFYLVFQTTEIGIMVKHFNLELDKTSSAFGDLELDLDTSSSQTNWEYDADGLGNWTAFPSGGLDVAYFGNQVRYNATLTPGIKWWRVRESILE